MIILFDESGTPTIRNEPNTDWFIGASVSYNKSDEDIIFKESKDAFKLSNKSPVKNDNIGKSHATKMAQLLGSLPLYIHVSKINISNELFRVNIIKYERFGNAARLTCRGIRNRPIAQIIHSHILDHCLFNAIESHVHLENEKSTFEIFIDNWAIPKNDINISLEDRVSSLQSQISSLKNKAITVHPIKLLIEDSNRKRFIDSIASIVSRAYLKKDNHKYSSDYENILRQSGKYADEDATQYSINIMQRMMEQN